LENQGLFPFVEQQERALIRDARRNVLGRIELTVRASDGWCADEKQEVERHRPYDTTPDEKE
jgi:hypothetical protein